MSAPEQKPRPAPVKMTTRTSSSLRASAQAARISFWSGRLRALSLSGRFRVTVAMLSCFS
jgi:hypothetical protein